MKVLKFGGTSVGSVESLRNVKSIVESIEGPAVVIVSALGGLTDRLIATAKTAAANDLTYLEEVEAMTERHLNIIDNVIDECNRRDVKDTVLSLLSDLKRMYDGVYLIRHLPQMTLDIIVSYGERMSSVIVAAMIKGGSRHDSLKFVKTEKWYDKNIADQKLTTHLIKEEFSKPFDKAIVPGFISTDCKTGDITNLGRGGSDFTAALVAAALDAEILEIWTDVDGFLSADPRIVPDAILVPHMTFIESMELCSFGAKVIYPPTIYPVFHKNIPIRILNTFNPSAKGTLITDSSCEGDLNVKGISAIRDTTLFHLGGNISGKLKNTVSRTFNALAKKGVKVFNVTRNDEKSGMSFAVAKADADVTYDLLCREFAPELSKGSLSLPERIDNVATIAVVGENMKYNSRLGARIRHTLSRDGINVEGHSEGASDTTMAYVVDSSKVDDALRHIHTLVF